MDYEKYINRIEDFHPDPYAVRALALEQDYEVPPTQSDPSQLGSVASICEVPQSIHNFTMDKLQSAFNGAVERASIQFRFSTTKTIRRQVCHADGPLMAGIVHLTLPQLCQGGTFFYRHKPTGHYAQTQGSEELYDYRNPDDWELTYQADMKFNCLVFYPGNLFHGVASPYFGNTKEDGRLTQNIFARVSTPLPF